MKRNLLTMALAMVFGVGAYAFQANDIIWTKDAKLKVTDATNKITNGNYAQTDGWVSENGGALAANWLVTTATKDDAQVTVLQSEGATNEEGTHLTNAWVLPTGIYALSYWVYSPSEVTTSITAGGNNVVSFYVSADGTTVARQINATTSLAEAAWTQVTDTIQVNSEQETVWFKASQVAQGIQFTDFQIVTVKSVYDTRIAERELAFAKQILEDPNFKTDYAVDEEFYDELAGAIKQIEGYIATGDAKMETETSAATQMKGLTDILADYMDAESDDIADETLFKYSTDLQQLPSKNRKNVTHEEVIGGFKFRGNDEMAAGAETHWQHQWSKDANGGRTVADNPVLLYGIQTNGGPGACSVVFYNAADMVKGKYYVAAEVRCANQDGNYNRTYNLESDVMSQFGDVRTKIATISGEEYQKIYGVGEYSGEGNFEAGFYWDAPVTTKGGLFEIKNVEIRYFGAKSAITDKAARTSAWNTFKAQWNAAVSARNKIVDLQSDVTYPWAKDSLERALTKHDVEYNKILNAGWMDADGNDAYAATASNDSLNNWAKYQGGVHVEGDAATYTLVRGYQYAYNYVINKNAPFTNLTAAIADAKAVRDDDMNSTGDKTTFQAAIDAAQGTYDNLLASTTNSTFKADSASLDEARKTLLAAQAVFLESAALTPIVDIDFSNGFEAVMEGETVMNYVIKGAKGEMVFGAADVDVTTNTTAKLWALGYNDMYKDVLRVGKADATVSIPETLTDNDVIRVCFDFWGGYLVSRQLLKFDMTNANGDRVAGFAMSANNSGTLSVTYNEFNNSANEGMDLLAKINRVGSRGVENDAIYTTAGNKTHFELIVDYKALSAQGIIKNDKNGESAGAAMPLPAMEDNKITKLVIGTGYDNAGRRSWFDNLLVYKYPSQAEGPIPSGIKNVKAAADNGAIYDLTGRRIVKAAKGLYIKNGKKYVIK